MYTLLAVTIRPERVPRGRSRRRQDGLCARRGASSIVLSSPLAARLRPLRCIPASSGHKPLFVIQQLERRGTVQPQLEAALLMVSVLAWLAVAQRQREAAIPGAVSRMRVRTTWRVYDPCLTSSIGDRRFFSSGGTLCSDRGIPDAEATRLSRARPTRSRGTGARGRC